MEVPATARSNARLTVTLVGTDGQPATNLPTTMSRPGVSPLFDGRTDAQGGIRFGPFPPACYRVWLGASATYSQTDLSEHELTANHTVDLGTIRLAACGLVNAGVARDDGEPFRGHRMVLDLQVSSSGAASLPKASAVPARCILLSAARGNPLSGASPAAQRLVGAGSHSSASADAGCAAVGGDESGAVGEGIGDQWPGSLACQTARMFVDGSLSLVTTQPEIDLVIPADPTLVGTAVTFQALSLSSTCMNATDALNAVLLAR